MSNNNIVLQGGSNTMYQNLKKKSEGFTIIEVLIVLAIAGLIMLIVFLAVPALQRNSRNNARNSDASRVSAAVTECLSNHNGQVTQCSGANAGNIAVGDTSQLTGTLSTVVVAPGGTIPTDAPANTGTVSAAAVIFGVRCNPDGSNGLINTNVSAREFAVRFQAEPGNVQRCIGS